MPKIHDIYLKSIMHSLSLECIFKSRQYNWNVNSRQNQEISKQVSTYWRLKQMLTCNYILQNVLLVRLTVKVLSKNLISDKKLTFCFKNLNILSFGSFLVSTKRAILNLFIVVFGNPFGTNWWIINLPLLNYGIKKINDRYL